MRRFSSSVNIKALINIPGCSDSSVCSDRENPYFTWQKELDLVCRLITTRFKKRTSVSCLHLSVRRRCLVCQHCPHSTQDPCLFLLLWSPGWIHPIFTCLGCSTLPLHHHQIFNFYFEIISRLQNSCKNGTKTYFSHNIP